MTTCPTCRESMPELTHKGKPRRYCSAGCAGRAGNERKRDMYVEEVEFMLDGSTSPHQILKALDVTAGNLSRALRRAERPDLARLFERVRWVERRSAA